MDTIFDPPQPDLTVRGEVLDVRITVARLKLSNRVDELESLSLDSPARCEAVQEVVDAMFELLELTAAASVVGGQ